MRDSGFQFRISIPDSNFWIPCFKVAQFYQLKLKAESLASELYIIIVYFIFQPEQADTIMVKAL